MKYLRQRLDNNWSRVVQITQVKSKFELGVKISSTRAIFHRITAHECYFDVNFFKVFFLSDTFTFWGHWYPCFGILVTSPLGFKARVGSALFSLHIWMYCIYIPWDPPLVLHVADLLMDSIAGINQVHILLKDITGTSEAQTCDHMIMSVMH